MSSLPHSQMEDANGNRSSVAAAAADKFTYEKNFMGIGQLHAKKEEEERLCRMHVVLRYRSNLQEETRPRWWVGLSLWRENYAMFYSVLVQMRSV